MPPTKSAEFSADFLISAYRPHQSDATAALLWRVERVRFCKRCLGGDLSPSSVAVATNCLQFSSHPRGSLFKIPFGFIQQERNAGIWTAVYICNSIASRNFVCYVRTTERRLPLGGKLSRKRLMRGDTSALTKGIHSPCASHPPIGREAAPCKNPPPPQTTKTSPQEHPPHTKRNKTSHCIGGCSWGEVPGGEGGLEGEEAPFQGGSFSLQGLPLTPIQKLPCRVGSIDPFRQSAFRDCRAQ